MSAKPISDYHMHTPLCGHATGEPKEYAQHAISVGLTEIGFSDHAPFVHKIDPKVTMSINQLPQYYQMIEEVRDLYKNELKVKIAIEADFIPGYEDKTKKILEDYPYDYVIGSVHFIKDWGFDDPGQRAAWRERDVNQVYRDYFELLMQAAQSQLFDIMAHVDLVKKFGHRPTEDMREEVAKVAQTFKECGAAIEINTSGLRRQAKEMYPSLEFLRIYYEAGVPLTFGSDSHQPDHVGTDFEAAAALAKEAGYSEYVLFKGRNIENTIQL